MAASSVALLATMLLGGTALGANGRNVYFGSAAPGTGGGYDADGDLVFGTLTNTRVTHGGKTATTLIVRNADNQTLNHVKVAGGAAADGKPYNLAFNKPTTPSLPGGATFSAVIPLNAGVTCDPNSSSSFECNVGTLAAGASASFLIVIRPPTTPIAPPATSASYPYWVTGSWNEGWSSTGTNADYNFATGTLLVEANGCAGGTASWFLGNESVDLGDGGGTCFNQDANIKSGAALGGNGGFATVAVDSTFAVTCPDGYKCGGNTVAVSILEGAAVNGKVEWTVTWFGTKTIKGVIHFADTYNASDPDHADDFTPILFTRANKCSATKLTDCWKSVTPGPGSAKFVTAVFVTDANGKGGGLF